MLLYMWLAFKLILFPPPGEPQLPQLFIVNVVTYLWLLLMLVFYLTHVFRNNRLARNERVVWAIILPLFNMFIMPVYWYIYIWREKALTAA